MNDDTNALIPGGKRLPPIKSRPGGMPHPLDSEWHVSVDDSVYGPFSGHDLKGMAAEGRLEDDSLRTKSGR
ncbi:MAG: DUF4339 domain-containing protein [Cellvibrionales bacterium]|nr:DUF4339 domain-containing protein [Cellvibrionales bacterium]